MGPEPALIPGASQRSHLFGEMTLLDMLTPIYGFKEAAPSTKDNAFGLPINFNILRGSTPYVPRRIHAEIIESILYLIFAVTATVFVGLRLFDNN